MPRSLLCAEPAGTFSAGESAPELLVLWQHPSREIVPIGRLAHSAQGYSFAYTRAAAGVSGLRPLLGMPDLYARYEGLDLPAVFEQRVMEPSRAGYSHYMRQLGLNPADASPWEQIVASGGSRAGDTLQFMAVPRVENGRARARFLVNGIRHIPEHKLFLERLGYVGASAYDHEAALQALHTGTPVDVWWQRENPHDEHAIVVTAEGTPLGWVPKALSASVFELIDSGAQIKLVVHRIGGPGAPAHTRLVLDLDAEAPFGFDFDRAGNWEPLA